MTLHYDNINSTVVNNDGAVAVADTADDPTHIRCI